MQEIKVKVGDKVIRYDGLAGTIVAVYEKDSIGLSADVLFETGEKRSYRQFDVILSKFYYRINDTVLGNKVTEEEIESAIDVIDSKIKPLQEKKKQLRKQLWRLREEMVEDWKERKQARINKKENQSTENNTED